MFLHLIFTPTHLVFAYNLYIYMYIYIYIYIYICICNHESTMCPPGYHPDGFEATHALGHMMYGYTLLLSMNQRMLNKLSKERNISSY